MKKIVGIIAAASLALVLSGCAGPESICGTKYEPYGLFTLDQANPKVHYSVSVGSIAVGVIFFETIIAPVYVFGWDLFQADGVKTAPGVLTDKCVA
jgi:hypothetical protein